MNTLRSPAPSVFNTVSQNIRNNSVFKNTMNTVSNIVASNTPKNTSSSFLSFKNGPSMTVIIFSVLVVFLIVFVSIFWKQIRDGWNVLYEQIRVFFGAAKSPPLPSYDNEKEYVTKDPVPPQDEALHHEKTLVEKALPGRQQVFNIHKNAYTYYDAEPLCKALGAELASYEQVKQAYAQGADWCNYGWVKGQMAVYPTQTDTWEQLQQGSEDQRGACGRPGLNGGYFDNPELRYGVNCYGIKPEQKDHDATAVASGEGAPLSPGGLEFEKKIQKYRGESNTISILPFSKDAWSA
jgi:hypothetical protein